MSDDLTLHPDADDQKLLAQVVAYYHQTLKTSPEVLTYLQGRGITNGDVIQQFRIGYADRSLGKKLPSKECKAGRAIRSRLEQLGLFRLSGHEHFTGSVVFPMFANDGTGQIVDLYGRKVLGKQLRKGTPLDVYLREQRHGVWNVAAFTASEEIILCPSVFDALTFWCHGYRNVTCTFGPDALIDDHLTAFQEFKVRRVLLVAEVLAPRLLDAGLDCYRLCLPQGVTVESYARQMNEPSEALGALIRRAEWLGKGQAVPTTTAPVSMTPTPMPTPIQEEPEDESSSGTDCGLRTAEDSQEETPTPSSEPTIPTTTNNPIPLRTASPLPPAPHEVDAEVHADEVRLTFGNRQYRVRGWQKNLSFDVLKVNLLVSNDTGLFVDTFDLYSAKHRRGFVVQASQELHVEEQTVKKDVGSVLLKLEQLQDQHIAQEFQPKDATPQMTAEEKAEALRLLRDPRLLDRMVSDFSIVGEPTNKLVGYLAAISRKLDDPLAVIIQSTTAAGKSTLMDAVLAFVPPEDLVKYSAMTGQSLFYMGETNLKHKILAIVEEEGAERASYALKLLQSEGELTIASTGKEASTGRLVTQEYRVEGPVMICLTTTSVQVDEELLNRCLVLTVDEDREQTRAIHQAQRQKQTLAGLLANQDRQQTLSLHRNAQRLLKPLLVANPYAESLTFSDDKTRTRRDHQKYLTLIRAIALLHQHQRPVKTVEHQGQQVEYIEVIPDDIATANRLAHEVLGRSLDELPPQTRRLLDLIDSMVTAACQAQGIDRCDYRFSRRDVREHTGWGHTQLKVHLKRLEEMEYLIVHRGGQGRSFAYELAYQKPTGDQDHFLAGLIDATQLRRTRSGSEAPKSGVNEPKSGHGRGKVAPKSGHSRGGKIDATSSPDGAKTPSTPETLENANSPGIFSDPSYPEVNHVP